MISVWVTVDGSVVSAGSVGSGPSVGGLCDIAALNVGLPAFLR